MNFLRIIGIMFIVLSIKPLTQALEMIDTLVGVVTLVTGVVLLDYTWEKNK